MRKIFLLLIVGILFLSVGCTNRLPDEVTFGINLAAQTAEQAVKDSRKTIDEVVLMIRVPYYKDLERHRNVILEKLKEGVTPGNFGERAAQLQTAYNKAKKKIDNEIEELRQKLYSTTINIDATYNLNSAISEYINREGKFNIESALDLGKQMLDIYKDVKK